MIVAPRAFSRATSFHHKPIARKAGLKRQAPLLDLSRREVLVLPVDRHGSIDAARLLAPCHEREATCQRRSSASRGQHLRAWNGCGGASRKKDQALALL